MSAIFQVPFDVWFDGRRNLSVRTRPSEKSRNQLDPVEGNAVMKEQERHRDAATAMANR